MSARIRGQEVTIRLAIDGQPQISNSWVKATEFTSTPRTDLTEEPFLGELEDDLDIQHHGFDLSFTLQIQDGAVIDFLEDIIRNEQRRRPHPDIVVQVVYNFRQPDTPSRIEIYRGVFLKVNEQSFSGRKDFVTFSIEGKAKRKEVRIPGQLLEG